MAAVSPVKKQQNRRSVRRFLAPGSHDVSWTALLPECTAVSVEVRDPVDLESPGESRRVQEGPEQEGLPVFIDCLCLSLTLSLLQLNTNS